MSLSFVPFWIWWKQNKNNFSGFITVKMGRVSRQSTEIVQWGLAELEQSDSNISFCLSGWGIIYLFMYFWHGIITVAHVYQVIFLKRKINVWFIVNYKDCQASWERYKTTRSMWALSFLSFCLIYIYRYESLVAKIGAFKSLQFMAWLLERCKSL